MKNAQIILDGIKFIERTDDIPTQAGIAKLEKNLLSMQMIMELTIQPLFLSLYHCL